MFSLCTETSVPFGSSSPIEDLKQVLGLFTSYVIFSFSQATISVKILTYVTFLFVSVVLIGLAPYLKQITLSKICILLYCRLIK